MTTTAVTLASRLVDTVGGKTAAALADAFDLHTVGDLLGHYPRRYTRLGELTPLAELQVGEHVTIQAEVTSAKGRRIRPRLHKLDVRVTDGRRFLVLTFFNKPWLERDLRPGQPAFFAGKVGEFRGKRQLTNPEVLLLDDPAEGAGFAGSLIPIYPASAALSTKVIARAVLVVLDGLTPPEDPLPAALRLRRGLLPLADALRLVHRPREWRDVDAATLRLKWDEAMVLQVTLAQRRAAAEQAPATPRRDRPDGLRAAFDARLPFTLTAGQAEVGALLATELARPHPMHRLLQGEVGSGKTVVALRAMLTVVDTGGQAALLAPTEVLATQHHRSLRDLLGPLGRAGELDGADEATRVVLLTGSSGAAARRDALSAAASGEAGIVVGTHALLEESVAFRDLGLVVVDEQHRFGVEQRDALRMRGDTPPHVLVMTATPIPRTVAMTVYGDLETSALTELPSGRAPIRSHVVPAESEPWVERMWGRVRDEITAGHQAFVVCPRIDAAAEEEPAGEDGRRPSAAVLDVAPRLAAEELAGLRLGVLHGRLPAEEKEAVMSAFAAGRLDVLVATTVVEVGVDVPNATAMVVLDADRFGVSQLHQLRGRVGRGRSGRESWCLLETSAPPGTPARERLDAVAATLDGAELALLDLRQRREGDVLGAAQSGGRSSLRLLRLLEDVDIIQAAREEATDLVRADPALTRHPALAATLAAALDEDRAGYLEKG